MAEKNDFKCLGYKIGHNGQKAWLYKADYNGESHYITDLREMYTDNETWVFFLTAVNGEFDTTTIPDEKIKGYCTVVKATTKKDYLITDEEVDEIFFGPKPEEPEEAEYVKPIGIWTGDEVNDLLRVLYHEFDLGWNEKMKITQEMVDFAKDKYGYNLLDELLGYKIKVKTKGKHKNDGQFVEYYFTLKSPHGVKTHFDTEMCLMVGWNYHEDLKIEL